MLSEFLKSISKNQFVWFVIPGTLIQGKIIEVHRELGGESIKSVTLTEVSIQGCSAPSLVIPGGLIQAWGPVAAAER